jgi:hypothetical protein
MRAILACLLFAAIFGRLLPDEKINGLPALHLNPDTITASGGSSGGYMCSMMMIIYSKTIKGCGDISGGPWKIGEDKNKVWTPKALTNFIINDIKESYENNLIDDPANLKGSTFATLV